MSILYPKIYKNKVTDITPELLASNNVQALILDVDNTLMDYDRNLISGLDEWKKQMDEAGIKMIIVSNSNKKDKVQQAADFLNISYVFFAVKPLKRGLKKAQKILNVPYANIAVVGDQIFTDVLGANRTKMVSILIEPIAQKDILITKIKRPVENMIKNRYFRKTNYKG